MTPFESHIVAQSAAFQQQRAGMLALVDDMLALEQRAAAASARAAPSFAKRKALLPRERFSRLLDPGLPLLPIANLAGYGLDDPNPDTCLPGGSLLAGIGFVVVLGIITDDPILKVHTMNRLRRVYSAEGFSPRESLERAVREAGAICLKPVLMTSLTTILALLPTLYLKGIGTELQRTMTLVIAGGLSVGTFFTLVFVPLVYEYIEKNKMRA